MEENTQKPVVKEIRVRILCPECRGAKQIMHPAWQMYKVAHPVPSNQIDEEWFTKKLALKYPPDQYVPCWECEGTGAISSWMYYDEFQNYAAGIPARQAQS